MPELEKEESSSEDSDPAFEKGETIKEDKVANEESEKLVEEQKSQLISKAATVKNDTAKKLTETRTSQFVSHESSILHELFFDKVKQKVLQNLNDQQENPRIRASEVSDFSEKVKNGDMQ